MAARLGDRDPVLLVNGLGGIGKTQLCRRYFWDHFDRYNFLIWIDYFDNLRNSFIGQFRNPQLAAREGETPDELFGRILHFLNNLDNNTLLIIDNLDNPSDPDLKYVLAFPFKVMVNSRQIIPGFNPYPLGYLSVERCQEIFRKHYSRKADNATLAKIITLAGRHTLTVELLAKTARNAGLTPEQLQQELSDVGFNLSEIAPESVSTGWDDNEVQQQLFEHLKKVFILTKIKDEQEQYILMNLSILPAVFIERKTLSEWLGLENKNALNALVKKGWLQEEDGGIFMHQVIQEVVRSELQPDATTCKSLIESVSGLLAYDVYDNPVDKMGYIDFGHTIWNHLGAEGLELALLANNLAALYKFSGNYSEAEPLYRHALEIWEKQLGPEHPNVATTLNNLAGLLQDQGKYSEAEPLYRHALEISEKQLGPEHPEVATTLNNLAGLLQDQGKYSEAEPLFRHALEIREKQLGPEHPEVATTLNNLALLLKAQGKYSDAEPLYRRALEIWEKQLGPEHPHVVAPLSGLAGLLQDQGKYSDAEPLFRRALEIDVKQLGPKHPSVAYSLNNLAGLLQDQGKYGEAEPLFRRALEIREKQLGPEHPDVASSLNNLAFLLKAQGKYSDAEPLYRRALEIREKQLGPEHPNVAITLNNLAFLLQDQGKYSEAEPLSRRALQIWEKALGENHPYTKIGRENLEILLAAKKEAGNK